VRLQTPHLQTGSPVPLPQRSTPAHACAQRSTARAVSFFDPIRSRDEKTRCDAARCRNLADRDLWNVQPADHSPLMFAALMIGHHFSISAFCSAPSASGVCWSRRKISSPISAKSARTFASANVSNIAALSFVMNVAGPSNRRLLPTERVAFPLNPVTIEYWRIVARRCGCGSLEVRNS
jgi:hypothetical protein